MQSQARRVYAPLKEQELKGALSYLFESGRADAARACLLAILHARRVEPSPLQQARIEGCENPATLLSWVKRAATATSANDVFA